MQAESQQQWPPWNSVGFSRVVPDGWSALISFMIFPLSIRGNSGLTSPMGAFLKFAPLEFSRIDCC